MSSTLNELQDFAKKVHQTLGSKFEGYRLNDLKFDIYDDFNINADDKANLLGYSSFKELIESEVFERYIVIQQDNGSLDNTKIYRAKPNDKYKLIYEQQKQWSKHMKNEQAKMLRKYAYCMPGSNNNNASQSFNNPGRFMPSYYYNRHGNKFSTIQRNYPQGLGEPQGLDDYFDEDFNKEENKKVESEEEEDEEYQDFRGSDSGKEEEFNEREKNKNKINYIQQYEVETSQRRGKERQKYFLSSQSTTNHITTKATERNNDEPSFGVSSTIYNNSKLIKNKKMSNGENNRLTKQNTTKTIWDEEEEEEENESCSSSYFIGNEMRKEESSSSNNNKNNYIYVPEGNLINIDNE